MRCPGLLFLMTVSTDFVSETPARRRTPFASLTLLLPTHRSQQSTATIADFGSPNAALPHESLALLHGELHQARARHEVKDACVPKLYPTRAIVAVLAVLAERGISNLRRLSAAAGFESHPLRQSTIPQ
jgi:hypothetical protein